MCPTVRGCWADRTAGMGFARELRLYGVLRSSPRSLRALAHVHELLYQVRIDRFAFSCRLWPPMVAGVRTNYLRLVAQSYATLDQRLLQILDVLKVVVGHSFVAQRPQPF